MNGVLWDIWYVHCGICEIGLFLLMEDEDTLQSRLDQCDGVSTYWRLYCSLNRFFSGAYQRNHQSSASLAFVRGIYTWPAGSPHKRPVTRKIFPFDDVIMKHFSRCYAYICTGNARSQDISNNFIGLVCPKYFNLNTRRVEQTEGENSQHSAQNIFKYIFLKENHHIFIKISMKFLTVPLT